MHGDLRGTTTLGLSGPGCNDKGDFISPSAQGVEPNY